MAEAKTAKKPRRSRKRPEAAPRSRGIAADELGSGTQPAAVTRLAEAVEADGGAVLARYRDPLGGSWQLLAGLPIDLVEPTPYQRDLSEAHVTRLSAAIDKLGRYLDPIVAVRTDEGRYWTPERQPPPRGAAGPRRPIGRRHRGARDGGGPPDPAAQHREGAQPARARAGGDPARRESRRAGPASGKGVRERVRGAGAAHARSLLPGERAIRRRRVSSGAQADREVPLLAAAQGAGDAAGARRPGAGAGRRGDRRREGAEGQGLREPLSSRLRGGADQPAPLQAGRQGGLRRDDRARCSPPPGGSTPAGSGPTRWRGRAARRRSRPSTREERKA